MYIVEIRSIKFEIWYVPVVGSLDICGEILVLEIQSFGHQVT